MPVRHYQWTRFWQSWEESSSAVPASDYLPELQDEWQRKYYSSYRTLAELDDVPCLVLLGEPGVGKSTAVADEFERLKSLGRKVENHDLKAFADARDLKETVFNPNIGAAATLFLDSLDEGRIITQNIAPVLNQQLSSFLKQTESSSNFRLRITCRSVEWPGSLTNELRDLFGEKRVQIWHLCQLRHSDVAAAAEHEDWGFDGSKFCSEVDRLAVTAVNRPGIAGGWSV